MKENNIICAKWGTKYPAAEVNSLYLAACRQSSRPVRFFCLTDDADGLHADIEVFPLDNSGLQAKIAGLQPALKRSNGALRKIGVFNPELIPDLQGPLLCLDIDIVISGNIDALFDYQPGMVCMPAPFRARPNIETKGEGSVIRFDPAQHSFLYHDMLEHTEEMLRFSKGSEQRYTSFRAHEHGALDNFPPDWVVSFLAHCRPPRPTNLWRRPQLPEGARIVCFPSNPKPLEAAHGYGRGLSRTRPAPWILDCLSA